ncbi:MAG: winged helix-turn-helix domain-containing protein [Streptosporangiaceae bacterium]
MWDYDFGGSSTVVSTYVTYLRRKLASDGPELIHTQRAVGYSLRLPRPGEPSDPGDEANPGAVSPAGQASADQGEAGPTAHPDESQAGSDEP